MNTQSAAPPTNQQRQRAVKFTDPEWERITGVAEDQDTSAGALIRVAVRAYLDQNGWRVAPQPHSLTTADIERFKRLRCYACDYEIAIPTDIPVPGVSLGTFLPHKGYVMGNVVPLCGECRQMQGDRTMQEFMDHVYRIARESGMLDAYRKDTQ